MAKKSSNLILPDLSVSGAKLQEVFESISQDDTVVNSKQFNQTFTSKSTKNDDDNQDTTTTSLFNLMSCISKTYYISKYKIIKELVEIICYYIGFKDLSPFDKSPNISIIPSNDNTISYAIVTSQLQSQSNNKSNKKVPIRDTIFCNEWIGMSNEPNKIYKYIFRYVPIDFNYTQSSRTIQVGIASTVDKDKLCDDIYYIGATKDSFCFNYYSNPESSQYGYGSTPQGWFIHNSTRRKEIQYFNLDEAQGIDCYFMLEIDLGKEKMKFVCSTLHNSPQYVSSHIPTFMIENKPWRVGISFKVKEVDCVAIGLVKI